MAALVLLNHDAIQRRQSAGLGRTRGNAASVINSIPLRRSARAGRPPTGADRASIDVIDARAHPAASLFAHALK